jgi:hypothetical protein
MKKLNEPLNIQIKEPYDYLPGFIDQFGDGPLGELDPKEWTAEEFLVWLKLNKFQLIKNK